MQPTQWDKFFQEDTLENWLYGACSLKGKTRGWLLDRMSLWPASTFLDAGCGGGVTAYQMSQRKLLSKIRYTGVDSSEIMLTVARKKTTHDNITWYRQDLNTLNLEKTFDNVLLRAVIEHNLDPKPILISVARHVAPCGKLYLIFWNNPVEEQDFIIERDKNGFYDIGHTKHGILETLAGSGLVLDEEYFIDEHSAKTAQRTIWVFTKKG